MKNAMLGLFLVLLSWGAQAQTPIQLGNTAVDTHTVIGGIDIPWEIVWGPDNHLWMTERYGRVSRVNPENGQQEVLLVLNDCHAVGESGLLGMTLHPNFPDSAYLYLVYTYLQGNQIRERLVRYTYNSGAGQLQQALILLDGIPAASTHNGSRLQFLPDGSLLMTTGDAQNLNAPPDTSSLLGKVLRLWPDGSIPADNPFPGNYVYSYGHRNAQGMFLHPNGKIYLSEHGPATDDELNIILPGRHYGWPTVNGYCNTPAEVAYCQANQVVEPIRAWTPTIAPAGMIWYGSGHLPVFENSIILTTLKNERLYVMQLNASGDSVLSENTYLYGLFGRLRALCTDPWGRLYLATNGPSWSNTQPFTHRIVRLSAAGSQLGLAKNVLHSQSVYPNPLNQESRLELPAHFEGQSFGLYDVTGRLLRTYQYQMPYLLLHASDLPAGVYVLKHQSSVAQLKLIKAQ